MISLAAIIPQVEFKRRQEGAEAQRDYVASFEDKRINEDSLAAEEEGKIKKENYWQEIKRRVQP